MHLPSKACEPCRTRKIGCDLRKPHCLNCEHAGWQCSYRDVSCLVIRDESSKVEAKVKSAQTNRSRAARKTLARRRQPDNQVLVDQVSAPNYRALIRSSSAAPRLFDLSMDTRAEAFFMKSLVTVPHRTHALQHMPRYLLQLLNTAPSTCPIHDITKAVSLMAFSRAYKDHVEARKLADAAYGRSLRSWRAQLNVDGRPEDIIMSGSLLVLYEMMAAPPDTDRRFYLHVWGVAAWMRQRGSQGVWTVPALHLYKILRLAVVFNSIQNAIPVDTSVWLHDDVPNLEDPCCPTTPRYLATRMIPLSVRVKDMLGTSVSDNSKKREQALQLVHEVYHVDNELEDWYQRLWCRVQSRLSSSKSIVILDLEDTPIHLTELPPEKNVLFTMLQCYYWTLRTYLQGWLLSCLDVLRKRFPYHPSDEYGSLELTYGSWGQHIVILQQIVTSISGSADAFIHDSSNVQARESPFSLKEPGDFINASCLINSLAVAAEAKLIPQWLRFIVEQQLRAIRENYRIAHGVGTA